MEPEKLAYFTLDEIWCDEDFNVRKDITPQSVASLAEDIRRNGLFSNPMVQELVPGLDDGRPVRAKVKLVMGHRRYNALLLNRRLHPEDERWRGVTCIVRAPLLASEARIMNLKENLERKELNMLEEAHGVEGFKKDGWSALKVSKELGVSKQWVEIRFGLLALPEEIQLRARANYLTQFQVQECIKKATREEQLQYVRNIVDHKERGLKITAENPEEKKKRQKAHALMSKGTARSIAQLAAVQEAIQDSFKDLRHPAAMALGFALGALSYEDFMVHVDRWISEENDRRAERNEDPIRFRHPEVLEALKL